MSAPTRILISIPFNEHPAHGIQVAAAEGRAAAAERERDAIAAQAAEDAAAAADHALTLRMAHAADVEDVLERQAADIEKLRAAHAQEVAALQEAHAARINALRSEHSEAVQTLQERLATLEVRHLTLSCLIRKTYDHCMQGQERLH